MDELEKPQLQNRTDSTLNVPQSAKEVLEVLDRLEEFTISIDKKITDEIKNSSKLIHIKLDDI